MRLPLRDGPITRFGVGIVPRRPGDVAAVVFALQGSAISTSSIPRSVPPHGEIAIDAAIYARFHDPEVIVTRDDGVTRQLAVDDRPGGFAARLSCSGQTGRQQIEIAASDSGGGKEAQLAVKHLPEGLSVSDGIRQALKSLAKG